MNAAGPWASSKGQLLSLYNSNSGAVVTKTFTIDVLAGNEEPNKYIGKSYSINSVGLSNKGAGYFIDAIKDLPAGKPLIASIAEVSSDKIVKLAKSLDGSRFDAIELNLSCPNILNKEPLAYDPIEIDKLLSRLTNITKLPLGVKLPPFITRSQIASISSMLVKFRLNHLVLINTYPLASMFIGGKCVIKPNDGIGGLGGSYLKPIALAHVQLFNKYLPKIPIIGVGGIQNRQDVNDFLQAGATAVQVGTAIGVNGAKVLNDLSIEF
jgi:dihydroorotate dehydrogenase (fumarate)